MYECIYFPYIVEKSLENITRMILWYCLIRLKCKHFGILFGEYQAPFETYVTYGVNIDHGSIEGSTT